MYIGINCTDNRNYNRYCTNSFKAKELPVWGKNILYSDKALYDAFAKTNTDTIFYKDYDAFVRKVKRAFRHYKTIKIIPVSLYNSVAEKYGTTEKAIQKIINDSGINVDTLPVKYYAQPFGEFLEEVTGTEKEFAGMKDASQNEKLSVILTNAWTRSELRKTFKNDCNKGTEWELVRYIWPNVVAPDVKGIPTKNLIEAYLVNSFKSGQKDLQGKNPLERFNSDNVDLSRAKIKFLTFLYKMVKNLRNESRTLNNINYQMKKALNIESFFGGEEGI